VSSVRGAQSLELPGVRIRKAAITEIDTLAAIDLDAGVLFERAGLFIDFPADHEFVVAERNRWLGCLAAGTTLLAIEGSGDPVGFAAAAALDGDGYLEQLSVRVRAMRRGIGTALLNATARAAKESGHRSLWLTTYGHLPWNRPFYERHGFIVTPAAMHSPGIAQELAHERRWLPLPHERVAMRKTLR
jgi:GNAT superfamily N-acetyltransferase